MDIYIPVKYGVNACKFGRWLGGRYSYNHLLLEFQKLDPPLHLYLSIYIIQRVSIKYQIIHIILYKVGHLAMYYVGTY